MTDFINFVKENWLWLATILVSTLSFLIHLFQKRPIARSLKDWCDFVIAEYLPQKIVNAECLSPCSGETKKADAIEHSLNVLRCFIKLTPDDETYATELFSKAIEQILATPRKKG